MDIIPALSGSDRKEFSDKLGRLVVLAKRIQIDFNDGTFERMRTLKPEDIADLVTDFTDKIEFEAHLMVQKPWPHCQRLIKSGFKRIIIQYEVEENVREILEGLTEEGVFVGLAISPASSIFESEPYWDLLDTVTVMNTEPGKQSSKFRLEELAKIRELKSGNFPGEVQAEGTVDDGTVRELAEAGTDILVAANYEEVKVD